MSDAWGEAMSERLVGRRSGMNWKPLSEWNDSDSETGHTVRAFKSWAESFLIQSCADLGRDGPVCPYVRPSIRRGLMWIGMSRGVPQRELVRGIISDAHEIFPALPGQGGHAQSVLRAMVTIFPELRDYSLIDELHAEFKTVFVERGAMLGQFYPGCAQPGLWNKDFRPLDAPLPMLVVRTMMPTDFPFLLDKPEWMNSYVRKFVPLLPAHVRAAVVDRLTAQPEPALSTGLR